MSAICAGGGPIHSVNILVQYVSPVVTRLFWENSKSEQRPDDATHAQSVMYLTTAEFQAYSNFKQMECSQLTESLAGDAKYSPISFLDKLACPSHIKNDIKVTLATDVIFYGILSELVRK